MSYLLGAGPRLTICLSPRPGNVQLRPKDDGPAILAKKGNTTNVRGTTQRGVRNTTRVDRLCVQHLDQRQHLESERLDVLQASHPNKQRRRGLASWPKSQPFRSTLFQKRSCEEFSDESTESCGKSTRLGKDQQNGY